MLRLSTKSWPLLLLVVACGRLLGLEEAYVDESLSESPNTASGGNTSATTGNSQSSSTTTDESSATSSTSSGGTSASSSSTKTTSASTSGGGEVSETTTSSAGEPVSLCQAYCDAIGEYCVDENLQYRDLAQCLRICSAFPEGELGDDDQNNIACRLKYAGKARYAAGTELGAYCRQAGPGGDDRCGSNCEGLCSIMMLACTEADASPYFYANTDDCLSDCTELPQVEYYYGIADGNSVQCRLFHAASAAMADPGEHCEHAFGVTLCESE